MDVAGLETLDPAPPEDVLLSRSSQRVSPGQLGLLCVKVFLGFFFLKCLSATGEPVKEEEGKSLFAR